VPSAHGEAHVRFASWRNAPLHASQRLALRVREANASLTKRQTYASNPSKPFRTFFLSNLTKASTNKENGSCRGA